MKIQTYRFALALIFLLIFNISFAQVNIEPEFPKADQKIKIVYDAAQGTTGLVGVDPVYIHIGAVLESSGSITWAVVPFEWGTANPDARMTKVAGKTDTWQFELSPNEFFNVTENQTIFRLGMVFRNADGSKEGKTEANGDFFVDLSQGFQVTFTDPVSPSILLEIGEVQEISIAASEASNLSLFLDDVEIASAQDTDKLSYTYQAQSAGTFILKAKAVKDQNEADAEVVINVVAPSPKEVLPSGIKKGINYLSGTEVILALQAPGKKNVFVIGEFNDWRVLPEYQMKVTPDGEIFWLKISDLISNQEYIFQYLVDGNIRIGDPYADKTSDPFHDQEIIEQGRYPGLKSYPEGKTQFQATYLQTSQSSYDWKYTDYEKPAVEELVIYELLVRDFDDRRTYKAVTERLDYLKELGINAIELMPVQEFEGNLSWGYNPSFFFAPDKYYGTKNDLKNLIDEAHKRNIIVIMDMVLNHAFGQNPMVRLYNDDDYGSPNPENPWFNRVAKHPFNVGYDFNHESSYTKAFVDSVNNYWLTEYKVDGFRFDLSKGFTQVNSGNDVEKWGQRDPSRITIWKNIYDNIKKNHPDAYVILEHFADNSEEVELAEYGMMLWGNLNGDFREMAKGNSRNFDQGYFKTRGWDKNNLVAYMESHDEERTMWESLIHGMTSPLNIRQLRNAINRNQLMATFFFSIPGPKMLWQFEEFGYDQELNNDRLGIKPTKWEYLDNPERQRLYNLYKAMNSLKNDYGFLNNPESAVLNLGENLKSIKIKDQDFQSVLYGNFGLADIDNAALTFPENGNWYNYFTGEEIQVTGTLGNFTLKANEFLLFTNQKLPKPEGIILDDPITSIADEIAISSFTLFPVPVKTNLKVMVPENIREFKYRLLDMTGRVLKEGSFYPYGNNLELEIKDFKAGLYIFEFNDNHQILRKRFIKD